MADAHSTPTTTGIYGAGGHAREIAWMLQRAAGNTDACAAFVDDSAADNATLCGLPVLTLDQFAARYPASDVILGVGNPDVRRRLAAKCTDAGVACRGLRDPSVLCSDAVSIDATCVIAAGSILTLDVTLGAHVHVNLQCSISHDVQVGAFSTLSPGSRICGNVVIGQGVFVGAGSTVINGKPGAPLSIADGAFIAAGACVTRSITEPGTYAGVPATRRNHSR